MTINVRYFSIPVYMDHLHIFIALLKCKSLKLLCYYVKKIFDSVKKRLPNVLVLYELIPKIFHPSIGRSCNNQAITSEYQSRFMIKNQKQIIPIQCSQQIIDLTLEFAFCGTDKPYAIYNPIIINKIYECI